MNGRVKKGTYVSPSWSGVKAAREFQVIFSLHTLSGCGVNVSIDSLVIDDKWRSLSIQRPESVVAAVVGILVVALLSLVGLGEGLHDGDDAEGTDDASIFVELRVPVE